MTEKRQNVFFDRSTSEEVIAKLALPEVGDQTISRELVESLKKKFVRPIKVTSGRFITWARNQPPPHQEVLIKALTETFMDRLGVSDEVRRHVRSTTPQEDLAEMQSFFKEDTSQLS